MCNLSNYVEEIGIKKGMGEEENAIAYIYDCVKKMRFFYQRRFWRN